MKLSVRNLEEADIPAVKGMLTDLIREEANRNPLRLPEPAPEYGERYFRRIHEYVRSGTGTIIVADADGQPVGVAAGYVREQSRDDVLEYKREKQGFVADLFVKNGFRGQGIGRKMMLELETYFRGKNCDCVVLTITSANDTAHIFYRELGYAEFRMDLLKHL